MLRKIANADGKPGFEKLATTADKEPACFHNNDLVLKQEIIKNQAKTNSVVTEAQVVKHETEDSSLANQEQEQNDANKILREDNDVANQDRDFDKNDGLDSPML